MTLSALLQGWVDSANCPELGVRGLTLDSRQVEAGFLFCACHGRDRHGLSFWEQAVARGAVAVLYDPLGAEKFDLEAVTVPAMALDSLGQKLSAIASRFYGHPSHHLGVITVTGTNGKTTVCQAIAQVLTLQNHRQVGVMGTLGNGVWGALESTGLTTADAITVQRQLAGMVAEGVKDVVLEISSHALDQGRVAALRYQVAIFTNLSRDHLDYHHTIEAYAAAKRGLFASRSLRWAVINYGDPIGRRWCDELEGTMNLIRYGFVGADIVERGLDLAATKLALTPQGFSFEVRSRWGSGRIDSPMLGAFNAENLLAALGGLIATGMNFTLALNLLGQVEGVAGRMERVTASGVGDAPTVVVDFAHTPDALQKAIVACRGHGFETITVLFGCGGDRDRGKRPEMGAVAEAEADQLVITSDNPRSEPPEAIMDDILRGLKRPDAARVVVDRREAIASTLATLPRDPRQLLLVAGKGHERYQEIAGVRHPYSDFSEIGQALARLRGGA
ncbi:MAG: UDP-N-acetylmuramoyl-L-alanyl-D-glutamate--2,6-diaminopimelate ligase [Gammaproteobacteria bacterium]|nr:UDP-N-acetylmuramoyl-L-alanyl-D-glutamate--2,6-diaminopimelate ligase [Gammaproteobacteria bacterium]